VQTAKVLSRHAACSNVLAAPLHCRPAGSRPPYRSTTRSLSLSTAPALPNQPPLLTLFTTSHLNQDAMRRSKPRSDLHCIPYPTSRSNHSQPPLASRHTRLSEAPRRRRSGRTAGPGDPNASASSCGRPAASERGYSSGGGSIVGGGEEMARRPRCPARVSLHLQPATGW
jgi:hypothetical protein